MSVGGSHDDHQEEERQHDFRDQARHQGVPAGRMFGVAVGGETRAQVEAGFAAGDDIQDGGTGDSASYLGDDVVRQFLAGKRRPAVSPIEMAGFRWQPEMCPMA